MTAERYINVMFAVAVSLPEAFGSLVRFQSFDSWQLVTL